MNYTQGLDEEFTLGIVFTSLIDMLEEKVSPEFADDVMEAGLENDGAYTVGYARLNKCNAC